MNNVILTIKNCLNEIISVSFDESNDKLDILACIPNREIKTLVKQTLIFIPYSRSNDWNYKQAARFLRFNLGNDNCQIIETDFTYKVHKKIGLSYQEEVNIVLLTIEFFLSERCEVTISNKINLQSEKQNSYLNKLIEDGKISINV